MRPRNTKCLGMTWLLKKNTWFGSMSCRFTSTQNTTQLQMNSIQTISPKRPKLNEIRMQFIFFNLFSCFHANFFPDVPSSHLAKDREAVSEWDLLYWRPKLVWPPSSKTTTCSHQTRPRNHLSLILMLALLMSNMGSMLELKNEANKLWPWILIIYIANDHSNWMNEVKCLIIAWLSCWMILTL